MKYSAQVMDTIGNDVVHSIWAGYTEKLGNNIENAITSWTLKIYKWYCAQIRPRQKIKWHWNDKQNGARTNSTAISKHKDWQKKDKYCNVSKFYRNWKKSFTWVNLEVKGGCT